MVVLTYTDLAKLDTFIDRYRYLKLGGKVGEDTFAIDRYLNQRFYHDSEWKRIRNYVILRDSNGDYCCDLGIADRPITGRIIVHHMNPISIEDITRKTKILLDPEYLICVSHNTHEAIHYGDESLLMDDVFVERTPNDTSPWRIEK